MILFAVLMCLLLTAHTVWAQPTAFGEKERQLKVCNLVITAAGTGDNPDPHVWYIADESAWLPFAWQLTNPNGPGHLTNTALSRWQAKYAAIPTPFPGLALGSRLGRDYAPYWEVISDLAELERLKEYDVVFIHNNSSTVTVLSRTEVQALNELADSGVTVIIEDHYHAGDLTRMTLSWPDAFPLFDPLFAVPVAPLVGQAFATRSPTVLATLRPTEALDRLLNYPYNLSLYEVRNLSDKPSTAWQQILYNNSLGSLAPLLQGTDDAGTGTFLAEGRYGSGHVVVSSLDMGCKINDYVRGGADLQSVSPRNDGIISGNEFTRAPDDPQRRKWDGDFKLLFNALDLGEEWTSFGANPRRLQSHTDFPGAVLGDEWSYQKSLASAPSAGAGFLIPSPVAANGVVFAVSPYGRMCALDLEPGRDLDGDGNPDDGVQETDPTATYDMIWAQNLGEAVATTPAIAHVNRSGGPNTGADIIIVATLSGNVYAFYLLPRNADGTLASSTTSAWSFTLPGGPAIASVSVARGVAYVVDSAGTVTALDLSASMRAIAGTTFIPAISLGANTTVVGTPAVALAKDELTGAVDETLYVPSTSTTGRIQAVVTYTSGEELLPETLPDGTATVWHSQRQAFTADTDPASLVVSADGATVPSGAYTASASPPPLNVQFSAPRLATADVRASYKVLPSATAAEKWNTTPGLPYLQGLQSPVYSSVALGPDGNLYFGAGTSPAGILYGFKDHGYFQQLNAAVPPQSINLGRAPQALFQIPLPTGWGVYASPAVGQDTVVFGLGKDDPPNAGEGMVVGLASEPDFTIHLGHSRIAVDNAFSVRDFNAPLSDPSWLMKQFDGTGAPNGYRLDAESGAITFSQRDAAKRIVVTYHFIDPSTGQVAVDALGVPILITEYHTLPRLVKWQFPSVGVQLPSSAIPIPAGARVLVTTPTSPYDRNDSVVQPLWIDRPSGFIHLPFSWLGSTFTFSVYVFVNGLPADSYGRACDYRRDSSLTPIFTIGRVTASPVIAGNAVFVDATRTFPIPTQPTSFYSAERDIFCLELDPAEGDEIDLDTNAAWASSFPSAFPLNFSKFRYQDEMTIDPDDGGNGNGAYDLLGVSRNTTVPAYVGSPALAEGKLVLTSSDTSGYWSLSALGGDLGYLGDGSRLLQLRRDGSAEAEWHSTTQRTTTDPVARIIANDRRPFSTQVSAGGLGALGRRGNLLVTDTKNSRVLEMDRTGRVRWRLDGSTGDYLTDSWSLLARGEPTTISRPNDAFRAEIPERNAAGALTGLRSDVTFISDSGNHRALAVSSHFDPTTDLHYSWHTFLSADLGSADVSMSVPDASGFPANGVVTIDQEQMAYSSRTGRTLDGLVRGINGTTPVAHLTGAQVIYPSPDLLWRTDPTQTVYQAVDRGAGSVILNSTTHLPTFRRQKIAGDYQYVSVQPVTMGQRGSLGVRWNDSAGMPEFDFAVAAVNNYALDRFPSVDRAADASDPHFPDYRFHTVESGPGASVALLWGQHFTAVTADAGAADVSISVASVAGASRWWPPQGTVIIDQERILYSSRTDTSLDGLTRGANGTIPVGHGVGSPVALLSYSGEIAAAFSGFYLDPAAADQTDPGDSSLTRVKWGQPYDRVFTQIESVDVSKVKEGYPDANWVTFYLTVAGTVARSPYDVSADPLTPPAGTGVYPITLMIYLGAPPADAGDYNSASDLAGAPNGVGLRLHGRPYLSVLPEAIPYAPGGTTSYFGRPTWFDQAKYSSLMVSFAASGYGPPRYPVQYTGKLDDGSYGFYGFFRPSGVVLSSNGHTYIIVNSHDQKAEVFEWEPALQPVTRLARDLSAADASMAVEDASGFPPSGVVLVDSEQIYYSSLTITPGSAPDTFNGLTRGVNGTVASGHRQGAWVFLVSANADLVMKNICPRPQTYSDGHPTFFGGASGLTRPSTLGRDY